MDGLEVVVVLQGGAHLVDAVGAGIEHDHREGAAVLAGGEQAVHERLPVAHRSVDKDQFAGGGRFDAVRGRSRLIDGGIAVDEGDGFTRRDRFDEGRGEFLRGSGLVAIDNGLAHGLEGLRGCGMGCALLHRLGGINVGRDGGIPGGRRCSGGRIGLGRSFALEQLRGGLGGGRLPGLILGRGLVRTVRGRFLGGRDQRFLLHALFHGHAGEDLGRVRGEEQTGFQFLEEERILPGFSAGARVHAVWCRGRTEKVQGAMAGRLVAVAAAAAGGAVWGLTDVGAGLAVAGAGAAAETPANRTVHLRPLGSR